MSNIQRQTVSVTVNSSGDATAYTTPLKGKLIAIVYTADGSTPYDNTVDFTITTESSLQTLWSESNISASKTCNPRAATHTTAGAAALYAAGGTAVLEQIAICDERIKIVLAQGGNAKTGTFTFTLE